MDTQLAIAVYSFAVANGLAWGFGSGRVLTAVIGAATTFLAFAALVNLVGQP